MTLTLTDIGAAGTPDRQAASRFRALGDAIAEIVFVTSADGRHVEMPRWLEITGQSADDIRDFGWLDAIHPEDRDATTTRWAESLARRALFRGSYRLRTHDGAYRRYDVRAAPVIGADGGVDEWIGVCIDMEERDEGERIRLAQERALRRSEQRFRTLVEGVAAVVWTADAAGGLGKGQDSWSAFTGQDQNAYVGAGWLDAVHPEDRPRTTRAWTNAHATSTLYENEHRLRRADGAYMPMSARAIPILDRSGDVREWLGFHIDTTRLRETETALRRLTAELEERVADRTHELHAAHRSLSETNANLEAIVEARTEALQTANEEVQRFAYIVSHDLRAPLVNIMGFANELRTLQGDLSAMLATLDPASRAALGSGPERLDHDIGESLDFILQSTGKMDRLIAAILRLSREGRRAFQSERVDLDATLREITGSLAHQCQSRDAVILVSPSLPVVVTDRLAVEQILTNLVENAVKYLSPGRPGVVRVDATHAEGGVHVRVTDNGRGIAPQDMERVFELFRRAGAQDQPGDGIGLAFVRARARRLGGTIECRSTLGEGSTFTLVLPAG